MSCLREVQTISKSPHILPMPSLTRLTSGGILNPLKNTTKIGHNKLLHQEPLQPPLEPSHPKVARNLTRSFFDIAHKRCNSNDPISMFEIIARELRATLLRNYGTTTAGIWRAHNACASRARQCRVPGRVFYALPLSWGTHPKVARNLTRSFFDIAHKRCNSNDSISMFEIIARELRATLLRNYGTTTAGIWRMQDADARRGHIVCPAAFSVRAPFPRLLTQKSHVI